VLFCARAAQGLFYELDGGSEKCFLEEVPKDTLVLGKFKLEDMNSPVDGGQPMLLGFSVKVLDPEKGVVIDRSMGSEGRFAFTSHIGGEHTICTSTNSSRWFGPAIKARVHLDLETGVGAVDYDEIAKQEHLSALEVSVRRLNDRVSSIRKEQNYQRAREVVFRNTSESTNSRVAWWSGMQVLVLVVMGVWQMRHLKSFFKAKKLV